MKSFSGSLWISCHDLLVSKSTCVTSGFMLNTAISISVALAVTQAGIQNTAEKTTSATGDLVSGGAGVNTSPLKAVCAFFITLTVFTAVLFTTAWLSRFIHQVQHIPERFRTTYANGLGFIPAWQWKNVVSALMAACLGGAVADKSPYLVAAVVLAISVLTAAVQITLENWVSAKDESTLAYQVFNSLKTSLGLGTGFAVNVLVYALVGAHMKVPWVMAVYVSVLTVAVAALQYNCKPMIDSKKDSWSPLTIKTLTFLLIASNFVVGWAWKGMIDMIVAAHSGEGILSQLCVALLITVALSCVVVAVTATSVATAATAVSGMPGLEDLCILASAMNVGWAWAGFAMVCLHQFEETNNDGKALGLVSIWLFTFLVVTIASIGAVGMEFVFQQIEPRKPEEELPLK